MPYVAKIPLDLKAKTISVAKWQKILWEFLKANKPDVLEKHD